jgi:hypothetical protein
MAVGEDQSAEHEAEDRPFGSREREGEKPESELWKPRFPPLAQVGAQRREENRRVERDLHAAHVAPEELCAPKEECERERAADPPAEAPSETHHEERARGEADHPDGERPRDRDRWRESKKMRRQEEQRIADAGGTRRGSVAWGVNEGMPLSNGAGVLEVDEAVVERKRETTSGDHELGLEHASHVERRDRKDGEREEDRAPPVEEGAQMLGHGWARRTR